MNYQGGDRPILFHKTIRTDAVKFGFSSPIPKFWETGFNSLQIRKIQRAIASVLVITPRDPVSLCLQGPQASSGNDLCGARRIYAFLSSDRPVAGYNLSVIASRYGGDLREDREHDAKNPQNAQRI